MNREIITATATSTPGHGGTFTITYIPARLHRHIFNSPMTAIAASINMVGATVVARTTVRVAATNLPHWQSRLLSEAPSWAVCAPH